MNESIDWSKMITSHGDDAWFDFLTSDEIVKLRRLYAAILKWREVADSELEEFKKDCEASHNPHWDEYGYDPVTDEEVWLLETERVMFANFAVTIASTAENFIIAICKKRHLAYSLGARTDFLTALNSLGNAIGENIFNLPGYADNQRARILGNCFKHTAGRTNDKFVEKYGGKLDETIEYENEDWEALIASTATLLSELAGRLKPKESN